MRLYVLAGLSSLALALTGCGEKAPQEPAAASSSADATPENAPGIALTDAIVQLPVVAGRPGVAYFTVSQGNGAPRKVAAVHVDGAGRAEMHESKMENGVSSMSPVKEVALEPGKTVEFKPGGFHVMLFDVADTLKAGGTTELTITLDNGDKATVVAKVTSPGGGEASGEMGGMEHMDHKM